MTRSARRRRRPAGAPGSSARSRWVVGTVAALAVAVGAWSLSSFGTSPAGASQPFTVASLRVDVLRELPHDTTAFTQGLLWRDGALYESTGQYGSSRLSRIDPRTGAVEQQVAILPTFWGEGLARVGDELFMLMFRAQRGLVFNIDTFEQIREFRYRGEGWGLCHDDDRLIMSNGSDTLTFRDPATFEETGAVRVTLRGQPLDRINELECVGDRVYANIWQNDYLVIIDPSTGRATHQIDATGLLTRQESRGVDVLNGVAYDANADTFYITGKLWPKMFEVRFVE